jgi:hypothetical protein
MKVLLFFSGKDSLSKSFHKGFMDNSCEVKIINFLEFHTDFRNTLYERSILFPRKYRTLIEKDYLTSIQKKYLEVIEKEQPELVFIYNDQMVRASTVKEIKKKAKVAVYLADNPFFLQRREHILPMLIEADHVFAPDSFWIEQLKAIGLKNVSFLLGGYDPEDEEEIIISEEERLRYNSDLFYIGSTYNDSWGYKRALFLSKFAGTDIKIYGPANWKYWFAYFPELESKMVLGERISTPTVQKIMKCCKLYPVDSNPGIINGLHVRIFDSIASGLLPLVEYKKDLETAFPGFKIPVIRNYNDIKELVKKCLADDNKRITLVKDLQEYLKECYNPEKVVSQVLESIY